MFKIGDRVKLNEKWGKACSVDLKYSIGTKGTITGLSRIEMCVMVLMDGTKRPSSWHQSFFTKIRTHIRVREFRPVTGVTLAKLACKNIMTGTLKSP